MAMMMTLRMIVETKPSQLSLRDYVGEKSYDFHTIIKVTNPSTLTSSFPDSLQYDPICMA